MSKNRLEKLSTFERWTEMPVLFLAVAMLVTLVIPLAIQISPSTQALLDIADWTIWALFGVELTIRTSLAQKKLNYLRKHWIDVVIVVLPVLRVFRLFRLVRLAIVARVAALFTRSVVKARIILSRYHFHYLLVIFLGLIAIASVLVYQYDKDLGEDSKSLPEALWLAIVNAFSGGFADTYPISPEAKGISIFLILFGTVIVSYFTALLASYFTDKEQDKEQHRIEKK